MWETYITLDEKVTFSAFRRGGSSKLHDLDPKVKGAFRLDGLKKSIFIFKDFSKIHILKNVLLNCSWKNSDYFSFYRGIL